jgi:hypothetical protein
MSNLFYLGYLDYDELLDALNPEAGPVYLAGQVQMRGSHEHGADMLLVTTAQVQGQTLHYHMLALQEYATMGGLPLARPALTFESKRPYYLARTQAVVVSLGGYLRGELGAGLDLRHALPWIPTPWVYGEMAQVEYDKAQDRFVLRPKVGAHG